MSRKEQRAGEIDLTHPTTRVRGTDGPLPGPSRLVIETRGGAILFVPPRGSVQTSARGGTGRDRRRAPCRRGNGSCAAGERGTRSVRRTNGGRRRGICRRLSGNAAETSRVSGFVARDSRGPARRRDGRVVEGGGLENRSGGNSTGGSNPSLSAILPSLEAHWAGKPSPRWGGRKGTLRGAAASRILRLRSPDGEMSEWFKERAWRARRRDERLQGSNPCLSARAAGAETLQCPVSGM